MWFKIRSAILTYHTFTHKSHLSCLLVLTLQRPLAKLNIPAKSERLKYHFQEKKEMELAKRERQFNNYT